VPRYRRGTLEVRLHWENKPVLVRNIIEDPNPLDSMMDSGMFNFKYCQQMNRKKSRDL
jgi:hypothetical protein